MSLATRSAPIALSIDDVPAGTGPRMLARTDDLASPGPAPSSPVSGAAMVGYDDTTVPPLGVDDVQAAIGVIVTDSVGSFLAPNEYYVDPTAPVQASARRFPTIAAALADGELNLPVGTAIVIRLRDALTHPWDLTGFAPASTRNVSIYSHLRETLVSISGTAVAGAAGAALSFGTVSVTQTANTDYGTNRQVAITDVTYSDAGFTVTWLNVPNANSDIFVVSNEYYVDPTQPAVSASRRFPTIAEAIADGELNLPVGSAIIIRLRDALTHLWPLTGFAVASARKVAIYSRLRETIVSISGVALAGAVGGALSFQTVSVTQTANINYGANRPVAITDVVYDNAGFTVAFSGLVTARGSTLVDPRWGGAVATRYDLAQCQINSSFGDAGPVIFDDAASLSSFVDCTFTIAESDFILFRKAGAGASCTFANCSLTAVQNGAFFVTLFDTGAATLFLYGMAIQAILSGAGQIDFGSSANLGSRSFFTQSGDTILNLPFVQNYAGAIAFARSITSPSAAILGSTGPVPTTFNRSVVLPGKVVTKVGDVIEITVRLDIPLAVPGDAGEWRVRIGGIDIYGPQILGPGVASGAGTLIKIRLLVGAVGVAGAYWTDGSAHMYHGPAFSNTTMILIPVVSQGPIDWTIDETVDVVWSWAALTPFTDEVKLTDMDVRVIRAGYN